MSQRVIIDLRELLRDFVDSLDPVPIPNYVLDEVVAFVFDVFIFELEDNHEEPELSRLGNFYRDRIENDPRFHQQFLESFFQLLKTLAEKLKYEGLYTGDGFSYRPSQVRNNRSIVVTKFDSIY